MRRAEAVLEYLDRPVPRADRDASLADMARLNAFGGYALTLRGIRRLAGRAPDSRPLLVIDVGGGRGDFARRLIREAPRLGRPVRVVVVDRDADLVTLAAGGQHPVPSVVRADATALPFREASADIVTISLTLHHLEPAAAVTSLGEMRTVARLGVVVNDLLRTRFSLGLVWLATRCFARHWISRHDGPLSVRRAYSPDELRILAEKAGVRALRVERHPRLARVLAVIET
jgi:ubiquinone/menaquinone biosynthesis C-methylase UbiE